MAIPPPTLTSFVIIAGIIAAVLVGRDFGNKVDCKTTALCKQGVKPWLKNPLNIIAYVVLALGVLCAMFNAGGRLGRMLGGGMGMGMMGMGMGSPY